MCLIACLGTSHVLALFDEHNRTSMLGLYGIVLRTVLLLKNCFDTT